MALYWDMGPNSLARAQDDGANSLLVWFLEDKRKKWPILNEVEMPEVSLA